MYTNTPGQPPSATACTLPWRASLAILVLGTGWAIPVLGQSTPNWGSDNPQSHAGVASPATTTPSAWGGTSTAAPNHSRNTDRNDARTAPIPSALAEILHRPDSDVITLTDGGTKTVKEIRTEVEKRQAVITALKSGDVPAGRKRVRVAVFRSPQHDELLNASKSLRDTARREAGSASPMPTVTATTTPTATPTGSAPPRDPPTSWATTRANSGASGQDPAAAWATTGSASDPRSQRQQIGALAAANAATQLHSGVGSATMAQAGAAIVPSSIKPAQSQLSQQPSQAYVAQNTPPGIALVNGHSKGVQFTPGGLYTIIGSGFGGTVGAVDLIGPHLPGGRLGLPVTHWGDRQLQAQLPEPVNGIADQPVTLRVTTRGGTLLTMDVQFYATRQPVTLTSADLDLSQAFDVTLGNPNDWSDTQTLWGTVMRTKSGNNIDCPSTGKDSLRTKFPPGWALVEVAMSSWLPSQGDPNKDFFGQAGDTVVSGSYNITQVPAGLTNQTFDVQWGVLRSHSTKGVSLIPHFTGNDFGWTGNDGCVSSYQVEVTLVGPAGVRPF
jgi:hypothetical protein